MKRLLALLLIPLTLGLVAPTPVGAAPPAVATVVDDPLKILFLGDSMLEERYGTSPLFWLASELTNGANISFELHYAAVGGYRCSTWINPPAPQQSARQLAAALQPDIVVLACGTNDAANGVTGAQMDAIYFNLVTEVLIGAPNAKVMGTWIQYSAVRTGLPNAQVIVNNAVYRQMLSTAPGTARYVHGTRIVPIVIDLQSLPEHLTDGGGIHLTPGGMKAMGLLLYRYLRAYFGWAHVAPTPCGLTGHQPGYGPGTYDPCNTVETIPA